MANNVEIEVTGQDRTGSTFAGIERKVKASFSKIFASAGDDGATALSARFQQRIGPLIAQAPISGPMLSSIAGAAPAMSALVGAAISGGAAVGAVGIGAAIVAQRPEVQKAATDMGKSVMAALQADASPMVKPVLAGIKQIENRMDALRPKIRSIFESGANYAPQLFNAVDRSLAKVVDGFEEIAGNAGPVVDVLENHIPRAVNATVDALVNMTEDSENTAAALAATFTILEATINATGQTVSFLNKILPYTSGLFLKTMDVIDGTAESTDGANFNLQEFLDGLGDTEVRAGGATVKIRELDEMMKQFADEATNAFNAETKFNEVLDESTRKAIEQGAGLDANTKRGRENREVLSTLAAQTRDSAAAMAAMAGGQERANEIMATGRERFIRLAVAAGVSAQRANELADELGLIPKTTNPAVKLQGDAAARERARLTERKLQQLERTYTSRVVVKVNYEGLLPSFAGDYRSAQRRYAHGGNLAAAASGGPRGNDVLVGEDGPEIVRLPYGSHVMTAGDSARAMSRGGAGGGAGGGWTGAPAIVLAPRIGASEALMDEIVRGIRVRVDQAGGDVQRVLGGGVRGGR